MARKGRLVTGGAVLMAAAIAVAVGCVWPSAWSPDSKRVILPVMTKETLNLLMVDATGKTVRRVAWSESNLVGYSAASWSPDGRRIAFVKGYTTEDGEQDRTAVVVQDAQTGADEVVWEGADKGKEGGGSFIRGPLWVKGSAALAFWDCAENRVVLLDLKSRKISPLPVPQEDWPLMTAVPSPDGSRVAYVSKDEKGNRVATFHVVSVADQKETALPLLVSLGDLSMFTTYPVWSPDGEAVFVPMVLPSEGKRERCALGRYEVATGKLDPVWKGDGEIGLIALSTGTGKVAAARSYPSGTGIVVIDPAGGQATLVHIGRDGGFVGLGISPDGRWVSFCPFSKGGKASAGAIVASDGSGLRAFQTVPGGGVDLAQMVLDRVTGALRMAGAEKLAQDLYAGKGSEAEKLPEALAALDRFAAQQRAPIFQEAAAGGKALLFSRVAADHPAMAADLRRQAQPYVDKWLSYYPHESLRAELRSAFEKGTLEGP